MVTGMDIKYEGRTRQGEQKMSFIDYAFSYSIPLNRVEITVYTFQLQNHVSKLVMALKQGNKLIR